MVPIEFYWLKITPGVHEYEPGISLTWTKGIITPNHFEPSNKNYYEFTMIKIRVMSYMLQIDVRGKKMSYRNFKEYGEWQKNERKKWIN